MVIRQERLAAAGNPFHRAACDSRGQRKGQMFRIGRPADAKPAAHILGADPDATRPPARSDARRCPRSAVIPWLLVHRSSISPSQAANAAFGSIGLPTTRLLVSVSRTTCAAAAKPALGRRLVAVIEGRKHRLPGTPSWISGAPGVRAAVASTTAGKLAYSTAINSAASLRLVRGFGHHQRHQLPHEADAVRRQCRARRDQQRLAAAFHRHHRIAAVEPGGHRVRPRSARR